MAIEYRVMDAEEAKLVDPHQVPWPENTIVLYAIEDDSIVGRIAWMELPHLEGCWTHPDKRGTSLAKRLVHKMEQIISAHGRSHAFAFSWDGQPEVAKLLEKDGWTEFPVTVYMKELKESLK